MTTISRRRAVQTAGAAVLAVPFAVPSSSFPRSPQPDPLLALEAQRVDAENASRRTEDMYLAAVRKARADLPAPPVRPTFKLTDPDNPTPDGKPIDDDLIDLTSLIVRHYTKKVDPQEIAGQQRERKRKEARFLLPGSDDLSPDWRSFVEIVNDAHCEAKEQYDRAVEQHDQAKEAINERPEIQQLDEAYAGCRRTSRQA